MFDPDWERIKYIARMKDDNCPKCGGEVIIDGSSYDHTYVGCLSCDWSYHFDATMIWETEPDPPETNQLDLFHHH